MDIFSKAPTDLDYSKKGHQIGSFPTILSAWEVATSASVCSDLGASYSGKRLGYGASFAWLWLLLCRSPRVFPNRRLGTDCLIRRISREWCR